MSAISSNNPFIQEPDNYGQPTELFPTIPEKKIPSRILEFGKRLVIRAQIARGLEGLKDRRPFLLHDVARLRSKETLDLVLNTGIYDINECDEKGRTPLHIAAKIGNVEGVINLIKKGADINAQRRGVNETALHLAALKGHSDVLEALVDEGAQIILSQGLSPIECAIKGSYKRRFNPLKTFKILIQAGDRHFHQMREYINSIHVNNQVDRIRFLHEKLSELEEQYKLAIKESPFFFLIGDAESQEASDLNAHFFYSDMFERNIIPIIFHMAGFNSHEDREEKSDI
ncbi:MAG: hypothetical protein COT85_02450 [Chlamydiae bacterium CG10_big_fil_rev_8_21_14_0_10_42_34]|nr:MAG: hypothetical protein COT85_02450 [Chlamydiae bacterium CG10_big_fil_rev_8_21_14_0_10_42_34]